MKFADPRLWVAFVSGAVVLYLVLGDLGRKSPGSVTAVHARAPELDGGQACAQCHGAELQAELGWSVARVDWAYETISEAMYQAVRAGGAPCSGLPWRWGYGWPQCW